MKLKMLGKLSSNVLVLDVLLTEMIALQVSNVSKESHNWFSIAYNNILST